MPMQMLLRHAFGNKQCKILCPPSRLLPVKSHASEQNLECDSMAVDASHQNATLRLFQEEHTASQGHKQPSHVLYSAWSASLSYAQQLRRAPVTNQRSSLTPTSCLSPCSYLSPQSCHVMSSVFHGLLKLMSCMRNSLVLSCCYKPRSILDSYLVDP